MIYFVIALNCILGVAITSAYYPVAGIIMLCFYVLMLTVGCNSKIGALFVKSQIRHWGNNVDQIVFSEKRLLISVACLSFALKVGAALTLFVETGAIFLLAFCILLAFGYFFDGPASGMTIGLSHGIARIVVKIFSFVSIGFDKIAEWIARAEFRILKIQH